MAIADSSVEGFGDDNVIGGSKEIFLFIFGCTYNSPLITLIVTTFCFGVNSFLYAQ
jgi:hypothetical protein